MRVSLDRFQMEGYTRSTPLEREGDEKAFDFFWQAMRLERRKVGKEGKGETAAAAASAITW